jgi:hypothetical protein
MAKSIAVLKRTTPCHMVAIHAKNWTPLGSVMMRLATEKNDSASAEANASLRDHANRGITLDGNVVDCLLKNREAGLVF